jgi:hypothetical protein
MENLTKEQIEELEIIQNEFSNKISNYLKNYDSELHSVILNSIQFGYHLLNKI